MKKPIFQHQEKVRQTGNISHNDFPVKSEPTRVASGMPNRKEEVLIELTFSQENFLNGLFGSEVSWQSIIQTVFNRSVNQMMLEKMTPFVPPATVPERAPNPLAIPRDEDGNLVEPPGGKASR